MTSLARPLRIFLWSYVFIYAVCTSLTITQVDAWWQLAEGRHILHTWTLPTQPVVAFGLPAAPYFDEYAGYEVVLALLFHFTGFIGLWLVFIAIYLAILFLPAATTGRKYPSFDLASIFALASAILLIHPRMEERPELVGVLFQVLLMVLLRASSLEKITPRFLGCLFLLFVAWSNVHSTFLFGFFTLGLWIANEWWLRFGSLPLATLLRQSAMVGAVALVAAMITPYGPKRLLFPFLEASDPGSTTLSPEMWPIMACPPVVLFIAFVGVAFLVWGVLTTRGLPLWLIGFAFFSVVISFKSVRFIDFAAVSLLFVYACRTEPASERQVPPILAIPRDLFYVLLCVFFLGMDVSAMLSNYAELRAERRFATHGLRFASDMAAYPVPAQDHRSPVLCGLGADAYVSFPGHGNFRPLLDSGLSHFSSDTKRYYFLAWLEPAALGIALDQLHVDYVLLDLDTFAWIPTLHRLPDWQFVTCSDHGMLWRRATGPHSLSADDRALITDVIERQEQKGNYPAAFVYSTLIDSPGESLALLARDPGLNWDEPFFNSLRAWVAALPSSDAQSFLSSGRCETCPLLGALLAARIGPEAYDSFVAAHPNAPGTWYWKAIATEELLQKGDMAGARKAFDSIPRVPVSSTTYYRLWREVHAQDVPPPQLSAYGRWQLWDDQSDGRFMEEMSARLNDRISLLDEATSR